MKSGAGILDWMDIWSAALLSIIHSILTSPQTVFSPTIDGWVRSATTTGYTTSEKAGNGNEARAVVILLMGSLLAARVFTRILLRVRPSSPLVEKARGEEIVVLEEKSAGETPAQTPTKRKKRGTTPKKSPGPGRG
jgi:hypothetical protein